MAGTEFRSGLSSGFSYSAQIDLEKLNKAIAGYDEEIRLVGIPRAINYGGRAGMVRVRRALTKQTGLKYSVVSQALRPEIATKHRWAYTIHASSKAIGLSQVGLRGKVGRPKRGGSYQVWARPWGEKHVYRNAFVIRNSRGVEEAYKRVGRGKHDIKMIYGPIVAYEMVRQGGGHVRQTVEQIVSIAEDIALNRLPHELAFAQAKAKAASGT